MPDPMKAPLDGPEPETENFRARIQAQIDRQPHFDEYMYVDSTKTALMVLLEIVEEQEYAADPHEWCHMRPTYLRALLALAALPAPPGDTLHHPIAKTMLDEEACIAEDRDVEVEVMVCAHCFDLAHPGGEVDDYYHPDVFWPCATARAAAPPGDLVGAVIDAAKRVARLLSNEHTRRAISIAPDTAGAALIESVAALASAERPESEEA